MGRTEGTREVERQVSSGYCGRKRVRLDRAQREGDLTRACLKRRSFAGCMRSLAPPAALPNLIPPSPPRPPSYSSSFSTAVVQTVRSIAVAVSPLTPLSLSFRSQAIEATLRLF